MSRQVVTLYGDDLHRWIDLLNIQREPLNDRELVAQDLESIGDLLVEIANAANDDMETVVEIADEDYSERDQGRRLRNRILPKLEKHRFVIYVGDVDKEVANAVCGQYDTHGWDVHFEDECAIFLRGVVDETEDAL